MRKNVKLIVAIFVMTAQCWVHSFGEQNSNDADSLTTKLENKRVAYQKIRMDIAAKYDLKVVKAWDEFNDAYAKYAEDRKEAYKDAQEKIVSKYADKINEAKEKFNKFRAVALEKKQIELDEAQASYSEEIALVKKTNSNQSP